MGVSFFEFNGQRSTDFGLTINEIPTHNIASRRVEEYEVPGRNGVLIQDSGAFSTVEQIYNCWFRSKTPPEYVREIASWLIGAKGFQILRDSYDPGVFRKARFSGQMQLENWMRRFGRLEVVFTCQPERWLDEGAVVQTLTNGDDVHNRWMRALPVIALTGNGAGVLNVGDYTVTLSNIPGTMILDADTQNAYNTTGNLNSLVTLPGGFPTLEQGQNIITWSGGITSVKITPRWWTL